jgi:uncharacterized protein
MNPFRIDVADLLTHPGARRPVVVEATLPALVVHGVRIDAPIKLDLMLQRVPDAVVARGSVATRFDTECSTCLQPISGDLSLEVSELYENHPIDGETYPLDGHVLDLEQLVRDALLLELPLAPNCSSVGAEACVAPAETTTDSSTDPSTGTDDLSSTDPRWAALSQLDL